MDFGSRYVYKYDLSDEECISDEEYDRGMQLSDSDEEEAEEEPVQRQASSGSRLMGFMRSNPLSGMASRFSRKKKGTSAKGTAHHWRNEKHGRGAAASAIKGRKCRRADTNVVKIKFETLKKPSHMHTGDPEYCSECQSVLSHLSKVSDSGGENKVWTCEFCSHANTVDLMPEEMPKDDDVTYMLEPALSTTATTKSGVDSSVIIFCVDISGSMCVTTEVPGKVRLRGDRLDRLQSLNDEHENQFMPGQRRDVTYVSRLQGMQAAIDQQLSDMQKEHPDRRVGLVAFNNEVTVIGDGSAEPVHLAKHKLTDKDELIKQGKELNLPKAIKDSRELLGDKVFELEEGGATALGPALLLSVAMASQASGSKVIICTDGLANVGVGSLDEEDQEKEDEAAEFYSQVSSMAATNGVSVSVISIKGADCKMVQLGKVADETGGQVNIVDPLQLTSQFGSILAEPVIATGVVAKFITHSRLYIRDDINALYDSSCIERVVGNVTASTEISFEFGVRTKKVASTKPGLPTDGTSGAGVASQEGQPRPSGQEGEAGPSGQHGPSGQEAGPSMERKGEMKEEEEADLPFQLQITYTDIEGAKALRVLTQSKPVTKQRAVAEQYLVPGVLGTHVVQTSATLASEGLYTQARSNAMMHQRLLARHKWAYGSRKKEVKSAYTEIFSKVKKLDGQLNVQQQGEKERTGSRYSDDEDSDEDMEITQSQQHVPPPRMKRSHSKLKKLRSRQCTDELANTTYQLKQASFPSEKK